MRKTIMAAVVVSAITGAAAGSMVGLAAAQDNASAPLLGGPSAEMGQHPDWMRHPGMMRWLHHRHEGRFGGPRPFGLFYQQSDRQLTTAEVQKIAEAFLLWHGNRTWKVAGIAENPDNTVGFAYAAPDGTLIAKFTMDRRTGHIARVG